MSNEVPENFLGGGIILDRKFCFADFFKNLIINFEILVCGFTCIYLGFSYEYAFYFISLCNIDKIVMLQHVKSMSSYSVLFFSVFLGRYVYISMPHLL